MQPVAHVGERDVGDLAGRLDAGDLAVVLDQAEVVDQAGGGPQLDLGEPAVGERALPGPGDRVGLEARAR